MIMVVHISRGRRSNLEAPMIIFTNKDSNYSICGLDDLVPRVSYRTIQKVGWTNLYFSNILWNPVLINLTYIIVLNMFGWIIILHTT